jgi:hypothetical protein
MVFLLLFICLFNGVNAESFATPTDLEPEYAEFDDDDYGRIDPQLIVRKVFVNALKEPIYYGDEVILIAILVDFLPDDVYTFIWEYSLDKENWEEIPDEHEQTFSFIVTHANVHYYWRVRVIL